MTHSLDGIEFHYPPTAEYHDFERIERVRDARIADATRLMERMHDWREEHSIPELETIDGAGVERAP